MKWHEELNLAKCGAIGSAIGRDQLRNRLDDRVIREKRLETAYSLGELPMFSVDQVQGGPVPPA